MKRKPIRGWLAAAVLVTSLWSGTPAFAYSLGKETKIDANQPEVSKAGFDIAKDYAVWIVEGEKTITLYDLNDNSEMKIGDKNSTKTSPHVDGNYVVWIDSRGSGSEVFLYDISKKKETKLTDDANASQVDIDGTNVVWADKRGGGSDIYLYSLTTGDEERISTSGKATNPTVSANFVAWEDTRNGDADIYTYEIKNQEEHAAVTGSGDQKHPALSGSKVLYENHSGSYTQIYVYNIGDERNKKLTSDSDDKSWPHLYSDTYVFLSDEELQYGDVDKSSTTEIESRVSNKLPPRIYKNYVIYAKTDSDKKLRLHLYDIKEEEEIPIGGGSGEPAEPAASDRYVVFISEGKKSSSVILYDVEAGVSKVVSPADSEPVRPLVSNDYVVWYDKNEDAIMSYDIRRGKVSQVTDSKQEPSKTLYELSGKNLVWVNEAKKEDVTLTDLSKGNSEKLTSLSKEPLSVAIYENYITWVASEGSSKASIYLYDIEDERDTQIRRNVQVDQASIGDNFVVWGEYIDSSNGNWDLYYYDIKRGRVQPLMRYTDRDQMKPTASRNMVLYTDNRLSPRPRDYYYELYDVEEGSFSDYSWSDNAVMEDPRIGGNRVVWIDTRSKSTPYVYTMAFGKPRDEDNGSNPGTPGSDDFKDYNFRQVLDDDTFVSIITHNDINKISFVLYPDTNKQQELSLIDALDDSKRFIAFINSGNWDDMVIRIYN